MAVSPGQAEACLNDIFWPCMVHTRRLRSLQKFQVSFYRQSDSLPTSYTSSSYLSTPSRTRCGVLASKLLLFHSRVDKVAVRPALGRTVAHKVAHNSGLERTRRKVEGPGPAPIVAELEQTYNARSHSFLTMRNLIPKFQALIAQCFVMITCVKLKSRNLN